MKKVIIAVLVAGALIGAVYGAAASITTVTTPDLGAGDSAVVACDSTITVAYTVAWDEGDNQYEVTEVTVSEAADCANGAAVSAQLTDTDGNGIGEATGTLTSGATGAMTVDTPPDAAAVEDIEVVINGG